MVELVLLGQHGLLRGAVVDQPVLPFALALRAQRGVERMVRPLQPAVHVDHVLLGHLERGRDLLDRLRAEVALLDRLHLALQPAQVEEQLLLRRGRAQLHQRPGVQDVFLDGGADPPHGVGGEPEAAVGVEALDRLHQADIALGDDLVHRQAVAAVAHGDLGDQAQMAGDQLVRGMEVVVLAPALGQHVLLALLQHREAADLAEIARKASALGGYDRKTGHAVEPWSGNSRDYHARGAPPGLAGSTIGLSADASSISRLFTLGWSPGTIRAWSLNFLLYACSH